MEQGLTPGAALFPAPPILRPAPLMCNFSLAQGLDSDELPGSVFLGGLSRELHFDCESSLPAPVVVLLLLHDLSQGEHERFPGSIHLKLPDGLPPGYFHARGQMLRVAFRCHAM